MLATHKDIPYLAKRMYEEKAKTCFAGYQCEWSIPLCAVHIQDVMTNPNYYIAVTYKLGTPSAVCGAFFYRAIMPPYPLVVLEWMWWGTNKRDTAKVWKECVSWGKSKGAVLAQYGINKKQTNPKKWVENYRWRVL